MKLKNLNNKTMTATIIAILLSLGIITSPADLDNLTQQQQDQIEIVIVDISGV
jgi:hypothetical protein